MLTDDLDFAQYCKQSIYLQQVLTDLILRSDYTETRSNIFKNKLPQMRREKLSFAILMCIIMKI